MNRIDSLFSLSFLSVLNQTKLPDCIVIVDDNNDPSVSQQIEKGYNPNKPIAVYTTSKIREQKTSPAQARGTPEYTS